MLIVGVFCSYCLLRKCLHFLSLSLSFLLPHSQQIKGFFFFPMWCSVVQFCTTVLLWWILHHRAGLWSNYTPKQPVVVQNCTIRLFRGAIMLLCCSVVQLYTNLLRCNFSPKSWCGAKWHHNNLLWCKGLSCGTILHHRTVVVQLCHRAVVVQSCTTVLLWCIIAP